MNGLKRLACLGVLAAAACAPAGYYDSAGYYHTYGSAGTSPTEPRIAGPAPVAPSTTVVEYGQPSYTTTTTTPYGTTYTFTRAGYYDRNGYIDSYSGAPVPSAYYPPRGMCRVWFPDRPVEYQPAVETCTGIQYRVPAGAYIVYGG